MERKNYREFIDHKREVKDCVKNSEMEVIYRIFFEKEKTSIVKNSIKHTKKYNSKCQKYTQNLTFKATKFLPYYNINQNIH